MRPTPTLVRRTPHWLLSWLLHVALLWTVLLAAPAWAATWTVNNLNDSGAGSLRDAIGAAAAGDTIQFQGGLTGTITLASPLTIDRNLTITGPGPSQLTVSGNDAVQVFRITAGTVAMSGLTVANGRIADTLWPGGAGGGLNLAKFATLTLRDCAFINNFAASWGGAIGSQGTLVIHACTLSGNRTEGEGGAIYVPADGSGDTTIVNSTLQGNTGSFFGAFANYRAARVVTSTFVDNRTANYGNAIGTYGTTASLVVQGTIFSSNNGGSGAISVNNGATINTSSSSHNLFYGNGSGDSAGYGTSNRILAPTAPVGALASNGGPTQTMLPTLAGGAIDALPCADMPSVDQRGISRPKGAKCDVGAVEVQQASTLSVTVSGNGGVSDSAGSSISMLSDPITTCTSSGGICNASREVTNAPAVITLIATPPSDGTVAWGGACTPVVGTPTQATVTLNPGQASAACTATFTRAGTGAASFIVTNSDNSGPGSLRDVIAVAQAGDQVAFDPVYFATPRTITLAGQLALTRNVAIDGPGAEQLAVSGNNASRVLQVNAGVTATVTGLTITGGRTNFSGGEGAGINNDGTLTLEDAVVTANAADASDGGGIYNGNGAALTLRRVTVSGNSVANTRYGGGLAVRATAASTIVEDSAFINNTGGTRGGAIDNAGRSAVISNSVFTGNSAFSGGAIGNSNYAMTISGSTFSGNHATASFGGNGGAIRAFSSGAVTLTNSTLTGNTAAGSGGGIHGAASLTVTHSTITGNTANTYGGLQRTAGTTRLTNTIVAGNTATTNNANTAYNDAGGTLNLTGGGNLVNSAAPKATTLDPSLAPLSANGAAPGAPQTHLPLPGSGAICAGVATTPMVTPDQRGAARGFDGYTPSPCVDAGAVQTHYALAFTQQPSDVLVDTALSPAPQVQLTENGQPFTQASASLTLSLPAGQGGVSGASASTSADDGMAEWPTLAIDAPGAARQLTASLVLNDAASVAALSDPFNVRAIAPVVLSNLQQTYTGAGLAAAVTTNPAGLLVTVTYDGGDALPVNAGSYAVVATIVSNEYIGSASGTLVIARAAQVLNFPPQTTASHRFSAGATFEIEPKATSTAANSGRPITYSSLDTGVCTVSGTTVTMAGQPGTCILAADQAGDDNHEAAAQATQTVALNAQKSFSGITVPPTGGTPGEATASFEGGGKTCRFDTSAGATAFIAAPAPPPAGKTLPQGMFQFKLIDCDDTAFTMSVTWPEPVTGYTKWGKESANATANSYFKPTDLNVSGNSVSFTVQDGKLGDDDWEVNTYIVDPSGPMADAATPQVTPIPTLGEWSLMLLGLLAAGLGARRLRRA